MHAPIGLRTCNTRSSMTHALAVVSVPATLPGEYPRVLDEAHEASSHGTWPAVGGRRMKSLFAASSSSARQRAARKASIILLVHGSSSATDRFESDVSYTLFVPPPAASMMDPL
jgi:hypothetical protein